STRKRPVIAARPWETFLKLPRTLNWRALPSTWTAGWGPADDLPYHGWDVCVPKTSVKQLTHQVRETGRTRRPASGCRVRATSGHAAAAPPTSDMNSRRFTASDSRASHRKDSTPRHGRLLHPSSWGNEMIAAENFFQGGSPKRGHPTYRAGNLPHHQKSFYAKFPGMAPG